MSSNLWRSSTQSELAIDQEKVYGRSVISPDLLLLDPVLVNGVPVRWVDAKNYYGAHIVNKRLIAKQVSRSRAPNGSRWIHVRSWNPMSRNGALALLSSAWATAT